MRAFSPAGRLGEGGNGLRESRLRRSGMHIENKNPPRLQTGQPELAAIVGKSAMMRLVTSTDRDTVNDFAVVRRTRFYVDGDQFVGTVTQSFDAERPDINKFLLSLDACKIRRRTGFVSAKRFDGKGESA